MTLTSVSLSFAFSCRRCSSRHPSAVLGLAVVVALLAMHVCDSAADAQQRGSVLITQPGQAGAHNGNYYALIIGINQYPSGMSQLRTAVNDAKEVGRLLHDQYGFQVQYLMDKEATRFKILEAIKKLRSTLNEEDNLLIYYGGHGHYDKDADKAYWLPVDAESAASPNVIMADDLTSEIRALPSRHVLIVSDSCYSGDLSRDASEPPPPATPTPKYLLKELQAKSRSVMASGGDEPVSDSGAEGHSVFAYALLKALQTYPDPAFSADELFYASVRKQVAGNSNQIPKYTHLRDSGDADGDFIFARKGAHINGAASSETAGTLTRSATTETASADAAPPEPVPTPIADIPNSNMTHAPSDSVSANDAFNHGMADLKSGQFPEAFRLLTVACNGGVSRGCGNLGVMYQNGRGVNQDLGQAAVLYRRGCSGDAWGACFLLGVMYESGSGVPRDPSQAILLYRRSCEGGDGRGCTSLGIAYATGNGVPKQEAQASSLFHKGCDTGVPRACSLLGMAYHEGAGLPKDDSQAALLTRKGCEGGDALGCNLLGVGYEFGYGVPKNMQQAIALYRQSCTAGFDPGCKNLNRVKR
jgi:TPR repeat protein